MNRLDSIAIRQDAARQRLANIGMAGIRPLIIKARAAAIHAYRWGSDPTRAAADAVQRQFTPVVQDAMVAAHLQARHQSMMGAAKVIRGSLALDAMSGAIDFLTKRLDLSDNDLQALSDLYSPAAAKMTSDLASDLDRKVSEAVLEAAKQGLHNQGGVELIRQAFDAAGVSPKNDFALETIFRTQVQVAYSAGQWNADQDPAIQEILWGYQYVTAGDDRVRPNHAALNGTRMTKEDPRWDRFTPPCGYNCRCTLIQVFVGDAEAHVVEPPTGMVQVGNKQIPVGPDPGWGFHPGKLYRDTLNVNVAA